MGVGSGGGEPSESENLRNGVLYDFRDPHRDQVHMCLRYSDDGLEGGNQDRPVKLRLCFLFRPSKLGMVLGDDEGEEPAIGWKCFVPSVCIAEAYRRRTQTLELKVALCEVNISSISRENIGVSDMVEYMVHHEPSWYRTAL